VCPITVTNLKKNAMPYGGPSSYKYNSPDYYSHGNYCRWTGNDSITVFDGDCYPGVFVYHASHAFDNSVLVNANKLATIYYVPLESDIDLRATYGDLYTRKEADEKSYYIQDIPVSIDGFV
jgi:hypothetical protein